MQRNGCEDDLAVARKVVEACSTRKDQYARDDCRRTKNCHTKMLTIISNKYLISHSDECPNFYGFRSNTFFKW